MEREREGRNDGERGDIQEMFSLDAVLFKMTSRQHIMLLLLCSCKVKFKLNLLVFKKILAESVMSSV